MAESSGSVFIFLYTDAVIFVDRITGGVIQQIGIAKGEMCQGLFQALKPDVSSDPIWVYTNAFVYQLRADDRNQTTQTDCVFVDCCFWNRVLPVAGHRCLNLQQAAILANSRKQ